MRTCSRCKVGKPPECFYRDKNNADGRTAYCKPCEKAYRKEYFDRPGIREKSRARALAYQASKPGFKQARMLYDIAYRVKTAAKRKARNQRNWLRDREKIFEQKYGMSIGDYDRMFTAQNGLCAICGNPPKNVRLAVDHCHSTGVVRGLLCFNCNHGIGHLKDDPKILEAAIEYLTRKPAQLPVATPEEI